MQQFLPYDRPVLGKPNANGGWPLSQVGPNEFRPLGRDVIDATAADNIRAVLSPFKFTPEGWDAFLNSGPWSTNIEDRR
jgi:hypothetical protein